MLISHQLWAGASSRMTTLLGPRGRLASAHPSRQGRGRGGAWGCGPGRQEEGWGGGLRQASRPRPETRQPGSFPESHNTTGAVTALSRQACPWRGSGRGPTGLGRGPGQAPRAWGWGWGWGRSPMGASHPEKLHPPNLLQGRPVGVQGPVSKGVDGTEAQAHPHWEEPPRSAWASTPTAAEEQAQGSARITRSPATL